MPGALAPGKNLRPSTNILKRPPKKFTGHHAIKRGRNLLKHGFWGVPAFRPLLEQRAFRVGSPKLISNQGTVPALSGSTCPESAGPETRCCASAAKNGAGAKRAGGGTQCARPFLRAGSPLAHQFSEQKATRKSNKHDASKSKIMQAKQHDSSRSKMMEAKATRCKHRLLFLGGKRPAGEAIRSRMAIRDLRRTLPQLGQS